MPLPRAYFQPRALDNLSLVDELESLDPILDSKVLNLLPNSDTPQIFAACGRGARSTLRTLRHGLEVEEARARQVPREVARPRVGPRPAVEEHEALRGFGQRGGVERGCGHGPSLLPQLGVVARWVEVGRGRRATAPRLQRRKHGRVSHVIPKR